MQGGAEARRLIASADIVLENFRPGVMEQAANWEPMPPSRPTLA